MNICNIIKKHKISMEVVLFASNSNSSTLHMSHVSNAFERLKQIYLYFTIINYPFVNSDISVE